jgi:putative NADPH-quinone reductase
MNAKVPANRAPVEAMVQDLEWAEALVLVFPTWWSGVPAILKGWLDRVFLPGVAFELAKDGPVRGKLTNIRVWAVITTCGSTPLQVLALFDPVRVYMRALRLAAARHAKPVFLRLYRMDSVTAEERAAFLARVRERMRSLA